MNIIDTYEYKYLLIGQFILPKGQLSIYQNARTEVRGIMPKVVPEYKDKARRRIIENALTLFSERGYYKTRMVDVAKRMGVSKGAIYQYFRSKRELFLAVLEQHANMRRNVMHGFLQSGNFEVIASGVFFDKMVSVRMGSYLLTQDILREISNTSFKHQLSDTTKGWISGLSSLISKYKQDGVVKDGIDADAISRGIIALRDGLYGSLDLGADISEVRKTWVSIMGILMKEILV